MQRTKHHAAFMLTDMLIIMGILAVIVAMILPVLASTRSPTSGTAAIASLTSPSSGRHVTARRMQNSTQLRGIHAGLVLYAQGNNGHYVGVKSDGKTIDSMVGLTAQGRVQKLIEDNYFTIEYTRSPSESQTGTTSYAMLKIDANPDGKTIEKSIRNSEWYDTANTNAVVVSDRAVPVNGSYTHIRSIHTSPSPGQSNWRGSVAWNDNHVTFEDTFNLSTQYGTTFHTFDNLFATSDPNNGDDAFMVWHGSDGL